MANTVNTLKDKTQDQASAAMDRAREGASRIADQAKDKAGAVAERAQGMASSMAGKAEDLASNLGQKADSAVASVGEQMSNLADTIRDKGPREGTFGSMTSSVAEKLDAGGSYLREEGLKGIADDLTQLVRRYPVQSLLVGLGVGFLLARSLRD